MKTLHILIISILIVTVAIVTIIEFSIQHSGTIMITPSRPSGVNDIAGDMQQTKSLSENDCGQFYTVPEDNHFHSLEVYPVLVLQQNSIGCAKLTYTVHYKYNNNNSRPIWPQMVNFGDMLRIGEYNYASSGNMFSMTQGKVYTHSFQIVAIPETVDLAKYPVGSQFTVTLIIRPLPNATGFYDYFLEEVPCDAYPLAVGYSLDQVNSSDFSKGMITMHNHSCFNAPDAISLVQVSGMDFKQIKFQ